MQEQMVMLDKHFFLSKEAPAASVPFGPISTAVGVKTTPASVVTSKEEADAVPISSSKATLILLHHLSFQQYVPAFQ